MGGVKELDEQIGMYDYGARFYDPSISLWTSVDPLTGDMPDQGAYNYTFQNPIMFNDPTGMKGEGVDGEFERVNGEWVKTSNIGDDIGVDFYHLDNVFDESTGGATQMTYINDQDGNNNEIKNGRKWLSGIQRDASTDYSNITKEFLNGTGPEHSLILGGEHPMNEDLSKHYLFQAKAKKFMASGSSKKGYTTGFNIFDAMASSASGSDMQTQMMGNYNLSFYRLGDKALVLGLDSKNRESLWYHLPVTNYSRSEGLFNGPLKRQTTTHQSYLFLGKMSQGAYGSKFIPIH